MNAVRAVSGGIEAALRDLIAQGSCCIAQPHGQRRAAVTVKRRMTSPYVQNLVVLATRGGDGEGSGGEGGGERVTRAYTVEVQTASVFYSRRVLSYISLSLEPVKHGHTISAVGVEPCTGRLYFSAGTRFMSTSS